MLTSPRDTTQTEIVLCANASANSITMIPIGPLGPAVSAGPALSPSKTATSKVPRPPNAFIIYRKEWHSRIVKENPALHNNKICECTPTVSYYSSEH